MSKYRHLIRTRNLPDKIPDELLGDVYDIVKLAVDEIDINNKTTNEVFGELYTKIRTSISIYGRHDKLKKIFPDRLKPMGSTGIGIHLNNIINELYKDKFGINNTIENLELCTFVMNRCVAEAESVGNESEKVITTLKQIDDDLNGEVYV